MATTPIVAVLPPGQTGLKLELYPADSDTIANGAGGDALSESTNRKSRYESSVTAAITGDHYAVVKTSGGSTLASGWIKSLKDTTETQYVMPTLEYRVVDSRSTAPAGWNDADSFTSGALSAIANDVALQSDIAALIATIADGGRTDLLIDAIKAKTDLIKSGSFTIAGPKFDATKRLELIRATDYKDGDGLAISIDLTTEADITGAEITWSARHKKHPDQVIESTGEVVSASDPKSIKIVASSSDLAKRPGIYGIAVFAKLDPSGNKIGVATGELELEDDWGSKVY